MSTEESDEVRASDSLTRFRAYQAVHAIVSDDNNYERGAEAARAVVDRVLAEPVPPG